MVSCIEPGISGGVWFTTRYLVVSGLEPGTVYLVVSGLEPGIPGGVLIRTRYTWWCLVLNQVSGGVWSRTRYLVLSSV